MTPVKEILAQMHNATEEDLALVRQAYDFAQKAHADHTRYSGEPYFIHPAAVAKMLAAAGMDAKTIAAGLLHDAIEDAKATQQEVKEKFGPEVLFLVDGVTKLGKHKYRGAERHAESLRRLLVATSSDIRVLIIKLTDRYHNMQTLEHVPEAKRKRIAVETLEIFAPLADRLGMGSVKKELEDLAFPFVDPDAYHHAAEVRKLARKENEVGLAKVQKDLQKELAKKGLRDFHTEVRVKGLWSLHQKLKRKGDDITKIHDIAALRVIVPTVDDCYTVLGIIHAHWKPLPGEFKDYIAFPKPNGYQSLHTTVLTPEAGIVEMQVRTEEMHQRARFGIAAHMSYKQLGKNAGKEVSKRVSFGWIRDLVPSLLNFSKKAPVVAEPEKSKEMKQAEAPRWLSELANAHTEIAGSSEFLSGLKEDFFSHRVFVFTPNGDVIDLPVESTPVDFAYAIHSTLGDHMQGAKVNDKLVSFDTTLHNGDRVEIIARDSVHPTAKWLELAKTSLARRHIRTALGLEAEKTRRANAPRSTKSKDKK
jgi:GTP pyrophosphokinase